MVSVSPPSRLLDGFCLKQGDFASLSFVISTDENIGMPAVLCLQVRTKPCVGGESYDKSETVLSAFVYYIDTYLFTALFWYNAVYGR